MQPKQKLDVSDGIQLLSEAQTAIDAIGAKLAFMQKLARQAADPSCDPVRRMELNLVFSKLKKEINEWANTSTGGIRLINGQQEPDGKN